MRVRRSIATRSVTSPRRKRILNSRDGDDSWEELGSNLRLSAAPASNLLALWCVPSKLSRNTLSWLAVRPLHKGDPRCLFSFPFILPINYPHPLHLRFLAPTLPYLRGNVIASICYTRSHSLHWLFPGHSPLSCPWQPSHSMSIPVLLGTINCYHSSKKPPRQHPSACVLITHPPVSSEDVSSSSLQNP